MPSSFLLNFQNSPFPYISVVNCAYREITLTESLSRKLIHHHRNSKCTDVVPFIIRSLRPNLATKWRTHSGSLVLYSSSSHCPLLMWLLEIILQMLWSTDDMHIIPSLPSLYLLSPIITEGHCHFVGTDSLVTPAYCLQLPEKYRPHWHHDTVSIY